MTLLVRDNAMDHPPFVIRIQNFLGAKMFLFVSLNKLWRGLYVRKTGNTMEDWNRTKTKAMDMLDSVPLLELASNYGLDLERFLIFPSTTKYSRESEESSERLVVGLKQWLVSKPKLLLLELFSIVFVLMS